MACATSFARALAAEHEPCRFDFMHPAVRTFAESRLDERARGLTPTEVGVMTKLWMLNPNDRRWDCEAPLRAALVDSAFLIWRDHRTNKNRFSYARRDLVELLELYGGEALEELDDVLTVYGTPFAKMAVASCRAKLALATVIRQRGATLPAPSPLATECSSNAP